MTVRRLLRPLEPWTTALAGVGFVGAALVARASYVVGSLPGAQVSRAVATGPDRWLYAVGVSLMVLAWLALGRIVLDPERSGGTSRVLTVGVATALPLLVAAPVTSQDVWAYLGQADVAVHGLDPYALGPHAVPGPLANAVAPEWRGTPSPYGAVWLTLVRLVVLVTGEHPWAGMVVLRALGVVALVGLGVALTGLARAVHGRPEVALWLAVTGPLPLLMMVAAVHNDSVLLALLVAGLAVAATQPLIRNALVGGAVLVGLAASIKVIALVALPFLPLLWFRYADPLRPSGGPDRTTGPPHRWWLTTGALTTALGVATVLVAGEVTGLGSGWVRNLHGGLVGTAWLSVPTQVGNLLHAIAPAHVAAAVHQRGPLVRGVGIGFVAACLALVGLTARRRRPLVSLALATLVLVVGSTAPRVWYLLWPLVCVAVVVSVARPPRALLVLTAAASASVALWFNPAVRPALPTWALCAIFAPIALVGWWWLRAPVTDPTPAERVASG